MALTPTGLTIRRFPEIRDAIRASILTNISSEIIFDSDTLIAQLVDIFAAELASQEELLQAIYDAQDRDKAEGSSLDSVVNLIGLQRTGAAFTSGNVLFTGSDGTTIPQGTTLANPSTADRFQTTAIGNLTQSSCQSCNYDVTTVTDNTDYTITVNGIAYTFTSGVGATAPQIVAGLVSEINSFADRTWEASPLTTPDRVHIATTNEANIALQVDALLVPSQITNFTPVAALVAGVIRAPENSVTQVVTAVGGITSATNPEALGTGRERETDTELRTRASRSLSLAGSATLPAIRAAVLNLTDVTNVIVEENSSSVVDAEGRPPKSFEVVVTAPDTDDINTSIATAIFNDKPAGIETFGTTTVVINDATGRPQTINFSRPSSVFIAARVTYTLYSEQTFPSNGNELIRQAVVSTGNSLAAGRDMDPALFYGPIYSSVQGITVTSIEVQELTAQGDTPDPAAWQVTPVPITQSAVASIAGSDVYITVN